jgi:hypothetical protein
MSATTELRGTTKVNLKHGMSEEEWAMLRQFMDPGEEEHLRMMA